MFACATGAIADVVFAAVAIASTPEVTYPEEKHEKHIAIFNEEDE